MSHSRTETRSINPLIGTSPADTIDNVCLCLEKLGVSLSSSADDNSIYFFCRSVSAALKYEACQLRTPEIERFKTTQQTHPETNS